MQLTKIDRKRLKNTKLIENYNFSKLSSLLADYGFCCLRLSDDWNGADFLAVHHEDETLKVQLKGRFCFGKKYKGKNIYVAFPVDPLNPDKSGWYLYDHDALLEESYAKNIAFTRGNNKSWEEKGFVSWSSPQSWAVEMLKPYLIK